MRLAIDGGTPVRTDPWVSPFQGADAVGELEEEYVLDVLRRRRFFRYLDRGRESYASELENAFCRRLEVPYALAVNGGTSALISALSGAGIGPGDEVVIPGYTFVATAAAVLSVRAIPIICEVDETLTMDPSSLESVITPQTAAVIPVHMRGVPCDMDSIESICSRHGLAIIEDVAQAMGGTYRGKPLGTFGEAGCFSLQQYKVITAGEGGIVVTSDRDTLVRSCMAHDSAMMFWGVLDAGEVQDFAGENYRISEINAALGLAQLQRLDDLLERMRSVNRRIREGLSDIEGVEVRPIHDEDGDVGICTIFYVSDGETAQRFSKALKAEGIPAGTVYDGGFADRHIYCNWSYVLEKRSATDARCPWSCHHYSGSVQYSRDMCPKTLSHLGRALHVGLNQMVSHQHADDLIEAVGKVAAALLWI